MDEELTQEYEKLYEEYEKVHALYNQGLDEAAEREKEITRLKDDIELLCEEVAHQKAHLYQAKEMLGKAGEVNDHSHKAFHLAIKSGEHDNLKHKAQLLINEAQHLNNEKLLRNRGWVIFGLMGWIGYLLNKLYF